MRTFQKNRYYIFTGILMLIFLFGGLLTLVKINFAEVSDLVYMFLCVFHFLFVFAYIYIPFYKKEVKS